MEPSASQPTSAVGTPATAAAVTDVLEAEKDGLVNVRFIPNDSRSAQIIVTNRSRKPLTLRLPHAFAGVPVAAQMGMGGMGGGMGGRGGGMGGGRGGRHVRRHERLGHGRHGRWWSVLNSAPKNPRPPRYHSLS